MNKAIKYQLVLFIGTFCLQLPYTSELLLLKLSQSFNYSLIITLLLNTNLPRLLCLQNLRLSISLVWTRLLSIGDHHEKGTGHDRTYIVVPWTRLFIFKNILNKFPPYLLGKKSNYTNNKRPESLIIGSTKLCMLLLLYKTISPHF